MKKTKETSINNTLLNIISPMSLEITRNSIILGENTGKVYGIVKYPQLEYVWLSRITNISGTICSINFNPMDSGIFIKIYQQTLIKIEELQILQRTP